MSIIDADVNPKENQVAHKTKNKLESEARPDESK